MRINKTRILIVTDSLGAPRFVDDEKITYEDTWIYTIISSLQEYSIEFIFFTINGLDSDKLLQLTQDKLLLYEADIVVFQFGIVDCAPRALKDFEIKLLSILRLSWIIRKILSRYHAFFSNLRNIKHIEINQFTINIQKISKLFKEKNTKLLHIPIAPPSKQYILKSPRVNENINLYNKIIEKNTDVFLKEVYAGCDIETIFLKDLHHLNALGHNILAKNMILILKKILKI